MSLFNGLLTYLVCNEVEYQWVEKAQGTYMRYLLLTIFLFYPFSVQSELRESEPGLAKYCPFGHKRGDVKQMLRTVAKLTPIQGKSSVDDSDYFKHHFKKKKRTWVVPPSHIWTAKRLKKLQNKSVGIGRGKVSLKKFYNREIILDVTTRDRSFAGVFHHEKNGVYIDCEYTIPIYDRGTTNTKRYIISMEAKLRDWEYEDEE
jgi:hypothetical protein